MLHYEVGFSVLKFDGQSRSIGHGIYFQGLNALVGFGMNPCNYLYTSEVIENLEQLFIKDMGEYEWGGGERTWFISAPALTTVMDNFSWQEDVELSTKDVLELMKLRKQLMDDWTKENITSLVKTSFESIKHNSSIFFDDEKASRYKMTDKESGLMVSLVLSEEDFNLTPEAYCNQLNFNDRFLPPQNECS